MSDAIKLLTFETGREEKLQMDYWIKERRRRVMRCNHILSDIYRCVNKSFQVFDHRYALYPALEELQEAQEKIQNLEWQALLRINPIGVDHAR